MKQAGMQIAYAGVDITQWMYVQMVQRDIGTKHASTMQKVGVSDGQMFQYMSRDVKTIVVTGIVMNDDLVPLRRSLAAAIDTDEPQQLIFGDEPDKYYLAIVDSQPTFTEGFRSGKISISFICPDGGIAHSVATQTADNMPYKDVPVNLQPDSNFTQLPSTWTEDGVVFDNSGEFAKLTSKGTTMQRIYGAGNPFASIPAGSQYTISFTAYSEIEGTSLKIGLFDSANLLKLTTTATYYKFSATKNLSDANALSVILLNAGDIIYIKKVKIELGASASPWSPNPADPEYYSDTITVQNDGTYPVYTVIDATMRGDNGVLTLINENNGAILQFGNPGEVDGVQAPNSETVFHYNLMSAPSGVAVNTGTINYPTYPYGSNPGPNTIAGSWDYAKNPDAATPVLDRTAAMHWAGPTYHGPIKANAAGVNTGNLIWSNRFNVTTSVGALGRVEFNLQSGNNIAICFVMRDNTYAADTLIVEGWVNGNNVFKQNLNRALFTNGMYEIVESKLGNTTTFRLTKVKQLNASGIVSSAQTVFPPVTIDGMADTPIDSFTVWMAGFSNKTGWTINWSDSVFQWVNVNYWKDLPNRFKDGDVVQIDVPNRRVFVNDAEDPTLQTIGNNWDEFKVQPGSNTIKLLTSSWAKQCEAEISWQEAWL